MGDGLEADAETAHGGIVGKIAGVSGNQSLDLMGDLPVRPAEVPHRHRGNADTVVIGEIGRTTWHPLAGDIVGRRTQDPLVAAELADLERGIGQWRAPDCHVVAFSHDVDEPVGKIHIDTDIRVERPEFHQIGQHVFAAEIHVRRNFQLAARRLGTGFQMVQRRIHFTKCHRGMAEQDLACFGQGQAPCGAGEQLRADFTLQRRQTAACRGGRQAEFPSGRRQVAQSGNAGKETQIIETHYTKISKSVTETSLIISQHRK